MRRILIRYWRGDLSNLLTSPPYHLRPIGYTLMRFAALPILLAFTALALTGCGPQKNASYDDANEMRQTVEDAGVACGDDEQSTGQYPGTTTLMCDEKVMLTVLGSDDAERDIKDSLEELGLSYVQAGNWIAASGYISRLEEVQEAIGGNLTRME